MALPCVAGGWSEAESFLPHSGMQERLGRPSRSATMPSGQGSGILGFVGIAKAIRQEHKSSILYLIASQVFAQIMYIDSLHIENIKAFQDCQLNFERPTGGFAGLNMFVGGNSAGKSTLLKSMAMVLSGPTVAAQQLVTTMGWLRKGTTKGFIELSLRWDPQRDTFTSGRPLTAETFKIGLTMEASEANAPIVLREKNYTTSNRTKVRTAERGPWHPDSNGWFLGAYGPLRRLTGSSTDALRYALGKGKLASCVTLFREDAALSESETWLKQEHARALEQPNSGRTQFVDDVKAFLNDGLLPENFQITKITVDQVYMSTPNGGELPLRDLSDGCRSAYAMMLDIIHNLAVAYGVTNFFVRDSEGRMVVDYPGVILIDELEAHLHPSWQRTICEWLRGRFPKIQFFIATHSPLILQSSDSGGIFVLPLPNEMNAGKGPRRLGPVEQQKIILGRAEKTLLGEAFGLKRTWGPRAEKLVQSWEKLNAIKEATGRLDAKDEAALVLLNSQMKIIFDDPNVEMSDAEVC